MIQSVDFRNFKVLWKTKLDLGRFTLIVGPNGSGKTTALQALQAAANPGSYTFEHLASVGYPCSTVEVVVHWGNPYNGLTTKAIWPSAGDRDQIYQDQEGRRVGDPTASSLRKFLTRIRSYSLDATAIANPVRLQPNLELAHNGGLLPGVLDQLRDREPERFEALNRELARWLPEFDRVLFSTPGSGVRAFLLRTHQQHHTIGASDLSQGTLLALAILTVAYLPDPPSIVCFEEPDRGIHPRLLREVRDALYRLSYPESFGDSREPAQVVATTHSPYFLDLFKDHPDEVIIAQKVGVEARFEPLSQRSDLQEILESAHLGEVWYSGILGGVPSGG